MLQIISGKFFTSPERHITEKWGVFYSNISWPQPIETCVATLIPADTYRGFATYVVRYKNQIEKRPSGSMSSFEVVSTGEWEVLSQFEALCIFGFRAWFSSDRTQLDLHCRTKSRGHRDLYLPSQFVPRVFETSIHATQAEVEGFIRLVEKVIGLTRESYETVMAVLQVLRNALDALSYNLDLAYSMLVYCLESLAQAFDQSKPSWQDYDEKVRKRLDDALQKFDRADDVRSILLKDKHLQLRKHLVTFVTRHLHDSFHEGEAEGLERAFRRSEIARALRNAYNLRSKFVHELKPIQSHLRMPHIAKADVWIWEREPYPTFAGLMRLTTHILRNFIDRQPSVSSEAFDWRSALPGIAQFELAPQLWVGRAEKLSTLNAKVFLSGLIQYLVQALKRGEPILDLKPLAEKCEKLLPNARIDNRRALLLIYKIWNTIAPEGQRCPNRGRIEQQYKTELEACSIDGLSAHALLGIQPPWLLDDSVTAYRQWQASKFSKDSVEIPLHLELTLVAMLANQARAEGRRDLWSLLLREAIPEATGYPELQTGLRRAEVEDAELDPSIFLPYLRHGADPQPA